MPENDDRILERIARELRRPVAVDATLDARVMDDVRALPRFVRRSVWSRLTSPRTVKVRPLPWALLAASLVLVAGLAGFIAVRALEEDSAPAVASLFRPAPPPAKQQRVQFVLVAPTARKVAVVGDFNGWDAAHTAYQAKHRGGGVWAVTAPVPTGHHRYSFVVDDSLWMADPTAPRAIDNDFGMPKSAIVVGGSNQ